MKRRHNFSPFKKILQEESPTSPPWGNKLLPLMTETHWIKCILQPPGLGGVSLLFVGFDLWFVCPSYAFVVLLLPDAHSDCARHHWLSETAKTVCVLAYRCAFVSWVSSAQVFFCILSDETISVQHRRSHYLSVQFEIVVKFFHFSFFFFLSAYFFL